MKFTIINALHSLRPGSIWVIRGDDTYANLEWNDPSQLKPAKHEIDAEIIRLQAQYDNDYARLRKLAYPSIEEQLDTIYHNGVDVWKAQIAAIKEQYPKV